MMEAGTMNDLGTEATGAAAKVGLGRWILFWTVALGGMAFDLATKSILFKRIGEPGSRPFSIVTNVLEFHTS